MPARVSRANTAAQTSSTPKNARQKNQKRGLDAYARAQELVPEKKIAKHRLGEIEDDEPRSKRRRREVESEEDDDEDDAEEPKRKRPAPQKRRNGAEDVDVEYGSDSDGNHWTMGGLADSDEDSDLDSEAAFGESDEERFAGMIFRRSKNGNLKGKKKSVGRVPKRKGGDEDMDLDLQEADESEDDSGDSQDEEGLGLGDEAVDLAAMLDDEEEEDVGRIRRKGAESGSEDDEDSEDDTESEASEEDDDADDEEKAARMRDRLDALYGAAEPEIAGHTSTPATTLKDAFAAFDETEEPVAESKKTKKRKREIKPTTLAAPLPKRQQDRLDREVAASMNNETMNRWQPTVQANRRAEHLSFPLQHPDDQSATIGRDKFQTAAQQAPATEVEEAVQRIMQESGLATKQAAGADDAEDEETALLRAEELAEKQIPVEEVMRRRAELRKRRDLMFYEEKKAARIKNIKSKSFRRVHRREREKQAEAEREAMQGLQMDGTEKERHDRQRAEARMSTRHRDSKWAKSLKQTNRNVWDDDARDGVIDQARRNEELKKRIAGREISDDEADDSFDEDDEAVLDKLEQDGGDRKGLAGLKFMRSAEERQRKQNAADIERLRREMAVGDGDEAESEEEQDEGLGRAIFGPASKETKQLARERLEFEAPDNSDNEDREEAADGTIVMNKEQKKTPAPKATIKPGMKGIKASGPLANSSTREPEPESRTLTSKNAWLTSAKGSSKKNAVVPDVSLATDVGNAMQSSTQVSKKCPKAEVGSTSTATNTDGWTTVTYKPSDPASDSEPDEPTNGMLSAEEARQTLQQRAFAGDDVVAAFEAEKAELAASEDEKEVSTHLPGWGSWTGDGLSKSIKKANKRAAHNPLYKTKLPGGVKAADRRDMKKGMEKVIVSEKGDRKGKKYLAPVLPHEFETREQYERSRRVPLGPEWTTKEVHQRNVKPRVVVRRGVNAEALERPLV